MMKEYPGKGSVRGACVQPRNHGGNGTCSLCGGARSPRGQVDGRHAKLLHRLQVIDFALQELVLYLDVYPECRRALDKYHALCRERTQLLAMLQQSGLPVCATDVSNTERWDWTDAPWPWEYDFAGNHQD